METLPTIQEVIEDRAKKRLEKDIHDFENAITAVTNKNSEFNSIANSVKFRYGDDSITGTNNISIQYLFRMAIVTDQVKKILLRWYVQDEVNKVINNIDKAANINEEEL